MFYFSTIPYFPIEFMLHLINEFILHLNSDNIFNLQRIHYHPFATYGTVYWDLLLTSFYPVINPLFFIIHNVTIMVPPSVTTYHLEFPVRSILHNNATGQSTTLISLNWLLCNALISAQIPYTALTKLTELFA
jgi:hypothetical protein